MLLLWKHHGAFLKTPLVLFSKHRLCFFLKTLWDMWKHSGSFLKTPWRFTQNTIGALVKTVGLLWKHHMVLFSKCHGIFHETPLLFLRTYTIGTFLQSTIVLSPKSLTAMVTRGAWSRSYAPSTGFHVLKNCNLLKPGCCRIWVSLNVLVFPRWLPESRTRGWRQERHLSSSLPRNPRCDNKPARLKARTG